MGQDFVGNQFRWHPCTIENRSPAPQESHPLGVCYDFADGWLNFEDDNTKNNTSQVQGSIPRLRPMSWWALDLPWALGPMLEWSRPNLDDSMESMRICKLFWAYDVDSAAPKWADDFLLVVCVPFHSFHLWTAGGGKALVTQQTPTWVSPKIGATKSVSLFQEQGNHRGLGA